jgi:2-dehydropantoate 2-reductase
MRILVVGAGAVGGYFGGRLLAAGREVTFLVRPARADKLHRNGLVIKSEAGDAAVADPPTVTHEALRAPFDLVILSCKAYDLEGAIDAFAPAVGARTAILPVLNGMRHLDLLDARFGTARVLGGLCIIAATLEESGAIRHLNQAHDLVFGARDGAAKEQVAAVGAAFADAGFAPRASDDIVGEMWEKWVLLSSLAAASCLMHAAVGDIVAAPGGLAFLNGLVDDCVAIAEANGHRPREAFIARARTMLTTAGSPFTASMFRDMQNGFPVEADHVLGDLIARRDAAGLKPPVQGRLDLAYLHLKAYEARRARGG